MENTNSEQSHVDQETVVDSYFSNYQPVEGETGDITSNEEKQTEVSTEKPVDKKIEKQESKKETSIETSKPRTYKDFKDVPNDFLKHFIVRDENGGFDFNIERANKFSSPEPLKFEPHWKTIPDEPKTAPEPQTSEERYYQMARQRLEAQKALEGNLLSWKPLLNQALGEHAGALAPYIDMVEKQIRESTLNPYLEELQLKYESERLAKTESQQKESEYWEGLKSTMYANQNQLISEFARTFDIDAKDATTEYLSFMNKYANPLLNLAFAISNPDTKELSSSDYAKTFEKWFIKNVGSNRNYINAIYKQALNNLRVDLQPHYLEKVAHGKTNYNKQLKKIGAQQPTGVSRETQKPEKDFNQIIRDTVGVAPDEF